TSGSSGIYAWNFICRGAATNRERALLVWLGSSSSRCNDVADTACVLSKGLSEGWPKRIASASPYTRALLDDANFGILTGISPTCFNTTTSTPLLNSCGSFRGMHALKHYRPDLINAILQQAQSLFGFDSAKVVGSGASMGARGVMRLGTVYPLRAVSVTGGNLETKSSRYMNALPYIPWDSGEGCWTLPSPNVGGSSSCADRVAPTLPQAVKFANTPVQIYASRGDAIANLTTDVQPTCDAINRARSSGKGGCQVKIITSSNVSTGPSHQALMSFGYTQADLNFLIRGYGGAAVSFRS
ncbi:hypothetical protein V8E36_008715, partial [Tilletia maclaganii]